MPKDPTRNQPNYKIGGSHLNEYEFDLNKGQITKEEEEHFPRSKQENAADAEDAGADDETNQKSNAQSKS
jgi:hypothetical protein